MMGRTDRISRWIILLSFLTIIFRQRKPLVPGFTLSLLVEAVVEALVDQTMLLIGVKVLAALVDQISGVEVLFAALVDQIMLLRVLVVLLSAVVVLLSAVLLSRAMLLRLSEKLKRDNRLSKLLGSILIIILSYFLKWPPFIFTTFLL
jgi:hypothetical protein